MLFIYNTFLWKASLAHISGWIFSNGSVGFSQVFATDLDGGLNGLIQYSIVSGNQAEAFQIDSQSGVITTSAVSDYESTRSYRWVQVHASYSGCSTCFLPILLLWLSFQCKLSSRSCFCFWTSLWSSLGHIKIVLEIIFCSEKVIKLVLKFDVFVALLNTKWETFKWQCLWKVYWTTVPLCGVTAFIKNKDWMTFFFNSLFFCVWKHSPVIRVLTVVLYSNKNDLIKSTCSTFQTFALNPRDAQACQTSMKERITVLHVS